MKRIKMNKIRIGVLCLMMAFFLGLSWGTTRQDADAGIEKIEFMRVPMGVIVLQPEGTVEPERSPVEFHHSKHFIYECRTCHHKWDGKTQISSCTASGCHDLLESPKKPTKYLAYTETGIKYFKYAFHQSCVGCHKAIKAQRKEMEMSYRMLKTKLPNTGPTGCIECHPKE
jgi:hypothetical protein